MNKNMPRVFVLILCVAVLLVALPPNAARSDDKMTATERLRKLETTQSGESRKLDRVVGDVAWLLDDLESNGLLQQAGGEKMNRFKLVLSNVADTRLPAAAGYLRDARLEKDAARHHLTTADEEVDAIVDDLAKVLAGSSALLAEAQLIQELKDLIKGQTVLRGESADWGKTMLISPDAAGAGKGPLMQEQTKIHKRYLAFLVKLRQAHENAWDEASKSRLKQAENVLSPPKSTVELIQQIQTPEPTVGELLQAAIDQLGHSDVLATVGAQDRAIASFKAALQILSAGQFELAEFVAGLERLIEKQKALRKKTEAEEDLENQHASYEAEQIEIQDEVTNYSFEAPDLFVSKEGEYLVEPLMISLVEAVDALNMAEKEKALAAQDKVIALLESVYGTATETLDEEDEGDPFWAYSPEIPEDKWKLPKDGDEEDEAMKDEDFPEIFEGIIAAELSIQADSVAQGAQEDVSTALAAPRMIGLDEEGDDEPPDFITDAGPPSVGNDKAPDAPGGKGQGDTSEVEKDRLARESMHRLRLKDKVQDFVRQLTPVFRRQVGDYYELIAE